MRYFLELAYRGTAYHGWQKQPNAVSVQEVVEDKIFTLTQIPTEVVAAGRTDAGVHAKQLFVHLDLDKVPGKNFVFRLNCLLPEDIAVLNIFQVKPNAHARFDAESRSYEYCIVQEKDPFKINAAYLVNRKPDVELMNKAAQILMEHTNFKCFSRSRTDVRTYNCSVKAAFWEQKGSQLIFTITADRFLRNMVRAIVGTLLKTGFGKQNLAEFREVIESEDRSRAGASVPAHGLYLTAIEYPKNIFLE